MYRHQRLYQVKVPWYLYIFWDVWVLVEGNIKTKYFVTDILTSETSLPHKSLLILSPLTYLCSETLTVIMQQAFSLFPLWFPSFPVPLIFIDPTDSKTRLSDFENKCDMCPTVLSSFSFLMASLLWKLLSSLLQRNSSGIIWVQLPLYIYFPVIK